MDTTHLDKKLLQSLSDGQFSRVERRALRDAIDEIGLDGAALDTFRKRAFALARESLADPDRSRVVDWLEGVVAALQPAKAAESGRAAVYFSPDHDCAGRITRLVDEAQTTADICVFTLTDDRISRALAAAHRRRVQVRIITDDEKSLDLGSDVEALEKAGMQVRTDHGVAHMHNKFAVFDKSVLITGSYNWTRSAASANHENIVLTEERRLVTPFVDMFETLWGRFSR